MKVRDCVRITSGSWEGYEGIVISVLAKAGPDDQSVLVLFEHGSVEKTLRFFEKDLEIVEELEELEIEMEPLEPVEKGN